MRARTLNDQLARQVLEGILAGEGSPDSIVAARGLAVVSDDFTLGANARRWLDDDEYLVRRRVHQEYRAAAGTT